MVGEGLRRGSAVARLIGLGVRNPPEARKSVSYECCVLPSRDLFVGLTTRPEDSNRVCACVCVIMKPV